MNDRYDNLRSRYRISIFYKQKDCLDFCDEHNEGVKNNNNTITKNVSRHTLDNELFICLAKDVQKPGKKGSKQYLTGTSLSFFRYLKLVNSKDRVYYEILREDLPCRMYMDLDISITRHPEMKDLNRYRALWIKDNLLTDFRKFLLEETSSNKRGISLFNCEASEPIKWSKDLERMLSSVAIGISSKVGYKFSLHVIWTNLILKNNCHCGALTRLFERWIVDKYGSQCETNKYYVKVDPSKYTFVIDRGVYTKNRVFRLPMNAKYDPDEGKMRYQKPIIMVWNKDDYYVVSESSSDGSSGKKKKIRIPKSSINFMDNSKIDFIYNSGIFERFLIQHCTSKKIHPIRIKCSDILNGCNTSNGVDTLLLRMSGKMGKDDKNDNKYGYVEPTSSSVGFTPLYLTAKEIKSLRLNPGRPIEEKEKRRVDNIFLNSSTSSSSSSSSSRTSRKRSLNDSESLNNKVYLSYDSIKNDFDVNQILSNKGSALVNQICTLKNRDLFNSKSDFQCAFEIDDRFLDVDESSSSEDDDDNSSFRFPKAFTNIIKPKEQLKKFSECIKSIESDIYSEVEEYVIGMGMYYGYWLENSKPTDFYSKGKRIIDIDRKVISYIYPSPANRACKIRKHNQLIYFNVYVGYAVTRRLMGSKLFERVCDDPIVKQIKKETLIGSSYYKLGAMRQLCFSRECKSIRNRPENRSRLPINNANKNDGHSMMLSPNFRFVKIANRINTMMKKLQELRYPVILGMNKQIIDVMFNTKMEDCDSAKMTINLRTLLKSISMQINNYFGGYIKLCFMMLSRRSEKDGEISKEKKNPLTKHPIDMINRCLDILELYDSNITNTTGYVKKLVVDKDVSYRICSKLMTERLMSSICRIVSDKDSIRLSSSLSSSSSPSRSLKDESIDFIGDGSLLNHPSFDISSISDSNLDLEQLKDNEYMIISSISENIILKIIRDFNDRRGVQTKHKNVLLENYCKYKQSLMYGFFVTPHLKNSLCDGEINIVHLCENILRYFQRFDNHDLKQFISADRDGDEKFKEYVKNIKNALYDLENYLEGVIKQSKKVSKLYWELLLPGSSEIIHRLYVYSTICVKEKYKLITITNGDTNKKQKRSKTTADIFDMFDDDNSSKSTSNIWNEFKSWENEINSSLSTKVVKEYDGIVETIILKNYLKYIR